MSKENNELMAKFLGYVQPHPDYPKSTYWYKENEQPLAILLFDTDWNWLMEVVEKIEKLNSVIEINSFFNPFQVRIYHNANISSFTRLERVYSDSQETKIGAVYEVCLNFIKTYNLKN